MPSISFLPTTAGRRRRPATSPRSGSAATADAVVWIGTVVVGIVVVVLSLLWWSRGSRMVDRLHRIWRTQMSESSSTEPFLFPGDLVDVWPDNNPFRNSNSPHTKKDPQKDTTNANVLTQVVSTNCLPSEHAAICQQRKQSPDSSTERIGILRPPGVWGDIFETFVIQYVEMSRTEYTDMDLISTSHMDTTIPHSFTKILRPAVLPLTLAALDLVLYCETNDKTDHIGTASSNVDHVLDVVRQLVRWHCQLSHVAISTRRS